MSPPAAPGGETSLPARLAELLERPSERAWWLGVGAAATLLRLAWWAGWEALELDVRLGYDAYVLVAQSWLGWIPPTQDVSHPPVFALWSALVLAAAGQPGLWAVKLANVLLSSASCLLLGAWARRALGDGALARLAGLWAACDPLLVFFAPQLQSEAFFLFLLLAFFHGLARLGHPPASALGTLALGVFGGVLTLTRSVVAFYPLVLCVLRVPPRWREPRAWLWLLLLAGWAAPIALWGARNQARYGRFIPLATNGGWNLWEGFTLDREEVRRRPVEMGTEARAAGLDIHDTAAIGDYFLAKTLRFAREEPAKALAIVAGKALLYWRPWPYDPYPVAVRWLLGGYYLFLFALALRGAWALRSRLDALAPVYALLLQLSLLHAVFFTSLRYRYPLEPFLCLLASAGLLCTPVRSLRLTAPDSPTPGGQTQCANPFLPSSYRLIIDHAWRRPRS